MRVYTSCGEFQVRDTWDRHDSARVYGMIIPERTYTIRATGTRNPSWSQFPNIIDIVEQKEAP